MCGLSSVSDVLTVGSTAGVWMCLTAGLVVGVCDMPQCDEVCLLW